MNTPQGRMAYSRWKIEAIQKASQNGLRLKDELEDWQSEREVVEAAIYQNPLAIRYAPLFQNDKTIAMYVIQKSGVRCLSFEASLICEN